MAFSARGTLQALTIPAATLPGNYYVGILVDPTSGVKGTPWGPISGIEESNESNNFASTPLTVTGWPDLTITAGPTVKPASVAPGGTVELSPWTVSNRGQGPSGDFEFGFYLATEPVITPLDMLLGSSSHTGLAPGESLNWGGQVLTIPAATAPGDYYIGLLVDHLFIVTESDETNNDVTRPLTVTAAPASVEIQITGLGDIVRGAETQEFGLVADSPIPTPVTGTLTLSFTPDSGFPDDPTVQFGTGGRTAVFSLEAGSTSAGSLPPFGTGTVAGTITLGASIDGEPLVTHSSRIEPGPPTITSVSIEATAQGFRINVTGFSTMLQVTQATFSFDGTHLGAQGQGTQSAAVDVDSAFRNYYSTGLGIGSVFTLRQEVVVNGVRGNIRSVRVQFTNSMGLSNSVSAAVNLN